MALKYLAVLGHPTVRDVYPYLHIPIDTIVYEEAEHPTAGFQVPRPVGEPVWSTLTRKEYCEYQCHLREAIAAHSCSALTPLDWEARAWIARAAGKE